MGSLSRELSITYAGYTVGGDQANRILEGVHTISRDYEKAEVGFTFVIRHDSEAAFASEVAVAEAAFRQPRQNLTIMLGTQTLATFSHGSNTGFNSFPRIVKRQDDLSSGRSRRYEVRVEFGLPANNVGTNYRRYSYVNVAYSPSRQRTLTITGTWTAGGASSARSNYATNFAAYASSVQTDLGGTWKLLEEPQTTADDQNKEINISATYEEIIFDGIGASDSSLRGERFTVTRSKFAPGDSPANGATVLRLSTISATYEAWFDKGATTALSSKWSTQRARAISYMQNLFSGGAFALVEEHPEFDPVHNKITARLVAQGASTSGVVEYTQTFARGVSTGVQLVPVASGDADQKYKYQGPGTRTITISHNYELIGATPPPALPDPGRMVILGDLVAVLVHEDENYTPVRRGFDGYEMDGIRGHATKKYELYVPLASGNPDVASQSGGGGNGNGVGPDTPSQGSQPPQGGPAPESPDFGSDDYPGSISTGQGSAPV